MTDADIYLVLYSHLDLFWLGEREECLSRGNRIVARALGLADADDRFRFLVESTAFVSHFLESHPEFADALRRQVAAGRVELTPSWANIMLTTASGEALVRNILLASRYLQALGLQPSTVAHPGDVPGFPPQYPQLLVRAGLRSAVVTRMLPQASPRFRWRSPDGSEVAGWNAYQRYDWASRRGLDRGAETAIANGLEAEAGEAIRRAEGPVLMHWGSDLSLPHRAPADAVADWNDGSRLSLRLATPQEFFSATDEQSGGPVLQGEVPSGWALGASDCVYPHLSWLDGSAVAALTTAERWAAIAYVEKLAPYPGEMLREAWRLLLESMDHNWDGTGAAEGDRRHAEYRRFALFTGEEIARRSTGVLAERVSMSGARRGLAVVVFNPLSWTRDGPVEAHVTFHGDPFAASPPRTRPPLQLLDDAGREVPLQVVDDHWLAAREARIAFVARGVPSVGYRAYVLAESDEEMAPTDPFQVAEDERGVAVGNGLVELRVDRTTGAVSLRLTGSGSPELERSLLEAVGTDAARQSAFEHRPTGERFAFEPRELQLVERGPARVIALISGHVAGADVGVEQRLTLWAGLPWLDVEEALTFAGRRPVRLQHLFETPWARGRVEYGLAFGTGSLDGVMPGAGPQQLHDDETNPECWATFREVQGWIDIGDGKGGLTVACDHRPFECVPPVLRADLAFVDLQPGRSTWRFRLVPHAGDWRSARSDHAGWELNYPLSAVSVLDPESPKPLPSSMSFASLGDSIITALKLCEDGERLVLRAFDPLGRPAHPPLGLWRPPNSLARADLLERPLSAADPGAVAFGRHEVVTLSLEM